jgi:hypothetical protein
LQEAFLPSPDRASEGLAMTRAEAHLETAFDIYSLQLFAEFSPAHW